MKSASKIVQGGGWLTHETTARPYARFFGFVSLIWLGVSVCASIPFWMDWPKSFGYLEWLCVVLLVLQPLFLILAVFFYLREQPRVITEVLPNPDRNNRNLY
jgi:cytochrome c oxidase subunit IV